MADLDPAASFTLIERHLIDLRSHLSTQEWAKAMEESRFLRALHRQFEAACETKLDAKRERAMRG